MAFKPKTYAEAMAKIASKRAKTAPKRIKKTKIRKVSKKGYYKQLLAENNHWIKHIPPGSHGSTPLQKRLWRLVTDYVRIKDFLRYGDCISCGHKFTSWQEAQGGHYRAYSKCKGMRKFDDLNVFAQCQFCNSRMNDDKFEGGRRFAENIVARYGEITLMKINTFTQGEPQKVEIPEIIIYMKQLINRMRELELLPDYFEKVNVYLCV